MFSPDPTVDMTMCPISGVPNGHFDPHAAAVVSSVILGLMFTPCIFGGFAMCVLGWMRGEF